MFSGYEPPQAILTRRDDPSPIPYCLTAKVLDISHLVYHLVKYFVNLNCVMHFVAIGLHLEKHVPGVENNS